MAWVVQEVLAVVVVAMEALEPASIVVEVDMLLVSPRLLLREERQLIMVAMEVEVPDTTTEVAEVVAIAGEAEVATMSAEAEVDHILIPHLRALRKAMLQTQVMDTLL
jgi:hypothetical protein